MRITPPFARARALAPPKGRPALPPHEKRSHVVEVSLNERERARLADLARSRGLAPAAYLRQRGLSLRLPKPLASGKVDPDRLDAIDRLWLTACRLRKELSPIGNNLNQLAHHANAGRYQAAAVELALQDLAPLVERLRVLETEAAQLLAGLVERDDR